MPSITRVFALAALVVASTATIIPRGAASRLGCSNPTVTHSSTIDVGGSTVQRTGLSCNASTAGSRRQVSAPTHVCDDPCTNSCNNNAGVLPPISEDCQTIVNAINILQGHSAVSFVLDSGDSETLSFGTCDYWFQNTSPIVLEYCWANMAITAPGAGAACFPPHQPFTSEGLCTSADGYWSVGAAHS